MRFPASMHTLLFAMSAMLWPALAEQILLSNSLNSCQAASKFQASLFHVAFTPKNSSIFINIAAASTIQGYVKFDIVAAAYGYQFLNQSIDPCSTKGVQGFCPMSPGPLRVPFSLPVSSDVTKRVPSIAYSIPDLDATVKILIRLLEDGKETTTVACLEVQISNGKTVDLAGVKWASAVVAGLALLSSAIGSGRGYSNAAAHVAANSLSLVSYFQSQAIVGLTGVHLPPIVQAWTQNFQWSMGIIKVGFTEEIFTWYQRATGGQPADIFHSLGVTSVQVQKRGIDMLPRTSDSNAIERRGNIKTSAGSYIVYGIQRVAFRANIETTNMFLTALTFFCVFIVATILVVACFKGICELAAKKKWMGEKFLDFRNGWLVSLKGILLRIGLIGFAPIAIFSLWEFTQVDSPALVVLAVFFLVGLLGTLCWGAYKVIRLARRSVDMHKSPAYILFSNLEALNKWGFLYIQFRASTYYFILPILAYTLAKAILVAFAQDKGIAQAIGFIVIEAAMLIAAAVLRPWMDKNTNVFNIAIYVVGLVNGICLLIFTNIFGAPELAVGVVGVVFFVLNAAFSMILIISVIVSTTVVFRKNPDARYKFMGDDRASFMASQTPLETTTELEALAATARGDKAGVGSLHQLGDSNVSLSREHGRARSPIHPSLPLLPTNGEYVQSPLHSPRLDPRHH